MKTIFAFLVTFFIGLAAAQAQWVNQTVPSNIGQIRKIHIIDVNNVWAEAKSSLPGPGGQTPGYLLRTTNSGLTWSSITVSLPNVTGQFEITSLEPINHDIAFITVTLATGNTTQVYKTTDAGQNWTLIPNIYISANSHANFVYFFDYQNGIIMGDNQEIYITNNMGTTWTRLPQTNLPAPASLEYTLDRRVGFGDTLWVPVSGMRLYRSTGKGSNWTVSNTNIPDNTPGYGPVVVGLAFQSAQNGLASHGPNLSRTTDGGLTWTPITYTGPFYRDGLIHLPGTLNSYLSFSPQSANPGMSLSTNGGLTWANIDNAVHYSAAFVNNMSGWSGGNGVMRKFSGILLNTKKETGTRNSFLIYPNPGQGLFHVTSASAAPFTLEVYDAVGHQVMQQQGNGFGKNTLDLSGQPKGIYLLHILNGEQHLIEKIVLQ